MNTLTEVKHVPLEPEAQALSDGTQPPYIYEIPPAQGRAAFDQAQSGPISKPEVQIEDLVIPVGPTGSVPIRIMRPPNAPATLPVILYIHGAGWVFGDTITHDRLIRELTVGGGAALVFPTYSLSPEVKYPTAIEQNYAVAKWIAEHGAEHGFDTDRFVIAGDSVGGNMTIALTLLAKERGGPLFQRQLLFYPVTNAAFDTESYFEFAEGYPLRRDGMFWFWDQYTTNPNDRAQITASPLRATIEQLQGLPPALVINGEADVLRDEGEAFARKLREAGVRVTAARFQGTVHDFVMLNPLADTAATRGAMALAISWLQAGFSGNPW